MGIKAVCHEISDGIFGRIRMKLHFGGYRLMLCATATIFMIFQPDAMSAEIDLPLEFRNAYPSNVNAENISALLSGHVLIGHGRTFRFDGVENGKPAFAYTGQDGMLVMCVTADDEQYHVRRLSWRPAKYQDKNYGQSVSGVVNFPTGDDSSPKFMSLHHDIETGSIVLTPVDGKLFRHIKGYLQKRLPAAIYILCPDFPGAEELGLEINPAQTALTYPELESQDVGDRIFRPDLISADPDGQTR